jgi:hypothetical protein
MAGQTPAGGVPYQHLAAHVTRCGSADGARDTSWLLVVYATGPPPSSVARKDIPLLLRSSSDPSEQPAVRRGVRFSRRSSPLSLSRKHSPALRLPFTFSVLMEIVRSSPMLLKGYGMNGVNLEATGGLRVMNGVMDQCRSIAPADVHGDCIALSPASCGQP